MTLILNRRIITKRARTITVEKEETQEERKKRLRREKYLRLFDVLSKKYPKCFTSEKKKPLKIGIIHDLRKKTKDVSARNINFFIRGYCNVKYYTQYKEGYKRVDLQGFLQDKLTKKDIKVAYQKIKKLKCKKS